MTRQALRGMLEVRYLPRHSGEAVAPDIASFWARTRTLVGASKFTISGMVGRMVRADATDAGSGVGSFAA
jgi:hypothetical protein